MEPFGLFQFLQSFLNQTTENTPTTPTPFASEKENNVAPPAEQGDANAEYGEQSDASNQAFLSFMQAHDRRAKRIKKS